MMITIPDSVLDRIVAHRPHLGSMVRNLRANPSRAVQFEKGIADAYLMGATHLSNLETWHLSACCVSERYGGGKRE